MSELPGLLETVEKLLACARSQDATMPPEVRAAYAAEARRAYDVAADKLKDLLTNLASVEAHLLGKSALLEEPKK